MQISMLRENSQSGSSVGVIRITRGNNVAMSNKAMCVRGEMSADIKLTFL